MPRKTKRKSPEKDLQNQILAWLKEKEILHWRQNSGFMFVPGSIVPKRPGRMVKLGPAGLPDIFCVLPPSGNVVGLEVKAGTGQRDTQVAFQARLEAVGGKYFIVRSLEQAREAICGPT